jgi:hypothetical protein
MEELVPPKFRGAWILQVLITSRPGIGLNIYYRMPLKSCVSFILKGFTALSF